ncbi:hypothetical protein [Prosthecochloris sp. CIB 2401]|uniref:hypothetical protein n=1 Tax=Prosthecochloris sp. CIB 2401 TaxID=1868325 RepID=UPI00080A95BB|nr:hypothetical protein [Prosthecochloris sp. CIB 2401]ANT64176.1 hypothetical protein Ptc2401_00375 [Prosthecochloris sp. CIB 2401]
MKTILKDVSGRIEPREIDALKFIKETANELGIKFFVVGAFARDILFEHLHGIHTWRATKDIDIGIEVSNWDEFQHLTGMLVTRGHFNSTELPHRFSDSSSPIFVDIVPYGEITDSLRRISWPPRHDRIMSMLGFEEAYLSTSTVRLSTEPMLDILVPAIPALALLKIISWDDAWPERSRDAEDLLFILKNCMTEDYREKLYSSYSQLLIEELYDPELASIRLLGQEIALMGNKETLRIVQDILIGETDENGALKLLSDMHKRTVADHSPLQLLKKLLQGIRDGSHQMQME